jgi:hypothetical protein
MIQARPGPRVRVRWLAAASLSPAYPRAWSEPVTLQADSESVDLDLNPGLSLLNLTEADSAGLSPSLLQRWHASATGSNLTVTTGDTTRTVAATVILRFLLPQMTRTVTLEPETSAT